MDISKLILFFLLLNCNTLMADEFKTASGEQREINGTFSNHMRGWIQKQFNGNLNICSDIFGSKWKKVNITQSPCPQLIAWVPKKTDFTEFVDVNDDGELKGGFSIAIFCLVLQELPFNIQPVFVPFINEAGESRGSYDELVQQIEGKSCEAVVGDITITTNRTKYVDFTMPYMSSGIYMLVPAAETWNQTLVTLIKPFTMKLWFTIILACVFIGVAVGILESRVNNPEFKVPIFQKLLMIIWFPVSTFFFNEGRIHNRFSKFVLVIWLTTIFIVMQIFTACLSSLLTVNQLQPKVPKQYSVVGYQVGSCVADFAIDREECPSSIERLQPLSSMDDYKTVLDNGTVGAIFDELAYVDIFIAKYGSNYMKVGPLAEEPGLGFALSHGSPLQTNVSRAVIKVTGSPNMTDMMKKYLRVITPFQPQADVGSGTQQSLDVNSFFLLFLSMGLATLMALIFSEISIMRTSAQINPVVLMNMRPPAQAQMAQLDQ
ncbi:hypothetical protein R6Q59_017968 [Mikania micrantha]